MPNSKCVLLINLGSPEKPETGAIRQYLRSFLSDPRVMDMPGIIRWMILNLMILPSRPAAILPMYKKLWDGKRFLLVKYSEELSQALDKELGQEYTVRIAMRYGKPAISKILDEIRNDGFSELIIVPLFPQYASATSGSILEEVFRTIQNWMVFPEIQTISSFFNHPGFVHAWCQIARPYLDASPDHILFSFHGLPESQILKADNSGHCLSDKSCCDGLEPSNQHCYRAQCFQTARSIARMLGLNADRYSVSFQSRLGPTKWIGPATSTIIEQLAAGGVKDLLVLCPAFVADCLETVEEIGVEEKERFIQGGGRQLTLVPSLNSEPVWVEALANLIRMRMV